MVGTALHWVTGPWKGKLALAARPRGGEWLDDEMAFWHQSGVDTVVSLLEADEERELGLSREREAAENAGIHFRSLPMQDRGVPSSDNTFTESLDFIDMELRAGRKAVLHCRQGVGRTGLVAACLLIAAGSDMESSLETLIKARGVKMPETKEQKEWIDRFAKSLASTR